MIDALNGAIAAMQHHPYVSIELDTAMSDYISTFVVALEENRRSVKIQPRE